MNTARRQRSSSAGFTLTEMVVVIAIIAIFTAFAVPSYKAIIVQNRMASEIGDLNGDIELARSAAIKQGVMVTICAAPTAGMTSTTIPACSANAAGWNAGWIVFTDVGGTGGASNQAYATGVGDTLLRIHPPLSGGDTVVTAPTTLAALTFNRMGGTTNAGTLSLHDANSTPAWLRCLVVSEVGLGTQYIATTSPPGTCP